MNSLRGWSLVADKVFQAVQPLTEQAKCIMNRAEFCREGGERRTTAWLRSERERWVTDERSAALLSENQPLVAELAIRALHSHELYAEVFGKFASGGKLISRVVPGARSRDLFAELRSDLLGRGCLPARVWALLHRSESSWT